MAIRIERNQEGNCINFHGSSNPTYFNACLSGEVDSSDNTAVNVINDIITAQSGTKQYEFFRIPFTEFVDADGNAFADAQEVADYITLHANVSAPTDINAGYKGVYDASLSVNPSYGSPENGDWYYIGTGGTITEGSGVTATTTVYKQNDIIKYSDTITTWEKIENKNATVQELEDSVLDRYDIHVDGDYTGTIRNGSSLYPYNDLNVAISASSEDNSILIKGVVEVPNSSTDAFTLPHSLYFYGTDNCEIRYASYNSANGNVFYFEGTDNSQSFSFRNIIIKNAGKYGIQIKKTSKVTIEDCTLKNNGWNGLTINTVLSSSVSGLLGYDSTNTELQAFYAGVTSSNGGATRIEEATQLLIVGNTVTNNLRGIRVSDCGIGGAGVISRNQSTQNIESGIYLSVGALGGCQNITVMMNVSSYNANNGLLVIGGINNKFSQNEVNGNWNAGFCSWGAANSTLRDCGLYDNNRSQYNGIGNTGDAKASIQINEAYNFLGTQITLNPAFRFIAEILGTQVHYTGLGSNSEKIGFLITSEVGQLPDNSKNIIKVDDVGFIGQDYAIDLSEVDVSNLRLSLGDNSFQSILHKAVKAPLSGNYNELPFSNHIMEVPEIDVLVDTLRHMITLTEGVGGNTINTYQMNELSSTVENGKIDILQANSDKIQIRDLMFGCIYINGVLAGNSLNSANDSLNAAFNMELVEYKEFLVSEVGINGDETSGGSLPVIANNWYVSYGSQSGTQITTATIGNDFRNYNPFYNGEALEKGHEFIWTHNPSYSYMIGIWGAAQSPQAGSAALSPSNWSQGFAFNGSSVKFSESDSSGVDIQQKGSVSDKYDMLNGQLAIRFGQDNYLYLFEVVSGGYSLIGKSNTTIAGSSVMIQWASSYEGSFPVMTERTETWEIVHDFDSSQNGEWSNGLEESTIIKSRVSVSPGEKITLNMNYFGSSERIGFGYIGASSGVTAAEDTIVDGFFYNTSEVLKEIGAAESNWTWNTSAKNSYDPNGDRSDIGYDGRMNTSNTLGLISFRYKSDNSLEMWHETNNELIATKKANLDGSAFSIYFGANENSHTADRIPHLTKYDMSTEEEGANLTGWFYIESPDGEFYYPLFITEVEANYIDSIEGGSGTSHSHTYADDTYNGGVNTWYMPDTSGVHSGTTAPQGGIFGNSINVFWNEIPTGEDSNYLPTFNSITYNVQEGSAINIQYKAAGMTETFNLTNIPNGYADNGYAIIGTAENITNGYGQSVQHVINVTKANNFGSVQGTITINVLADLSGNEFTIVEQANGIKFTQDAGGTTLDFNTVTFNAGSTYKFYLDHSSVEANDTLMVVDANGNAYTTGVTLSGTVGSAGAYLEFVIPADVPPVSLVWTDGDGAATVTVPMTVAGSSYSVEITGIDLEGPIANQTGTNIADNGGYGWLTIDEQLSAGQRFVMNNAFFEDLLGEMGDQYEIRIGLKGDNWDNGDQSTKSNTVVTGEVFKGDIQLRIYKSSSNNIYLQIFHSGIGGSNQMLINTVALHNTTCAFIEITSSGNNIRMGFGRNGYLGVTAGDESTASWSDWSSYKGQTGDQGYGISSLDVVFLVTDIFNENNDDYDGNNVDWTHLSEVSVPVTPTMDTAWTKALDFSGSNEHLKQVGNYYTVNPLRMNDYATNIAPPATSGYTANGGSVRPWATAIVFQSKNNTSNQHIWNQGEGTGTTDDNIYLRVTGTNGNLYFGWGRQGEVNECLIGNIGGVSNSTHWWGIYIANNGTRLSAANATAANLAAAFDIRLMGSNDAPSAWSGLYDVGTEADWTAGSTGARMDRSYTGDFTIGGRGSNRNFHGKVASMVVTTLRVNQPMPSDAEIRLMITDPKKWLDDYKIGELFRPNYTSGDFGSFAIGTETCHRATQIWLMGDGTYDSYANGIRNQVGPEDQNNNKLQLNSMQSHDIQNVTVTGLS